MGVYYYYDSPPPHFRTTGYVTMEGYNPSIVRDRVYRMLTRDGEFKNRKAAAALASAAAEEAKKVYAQVHRNLPAYMLTGLIEFRIIVAPCDDGYVKEMLENLFPAFPIKIIYNEEVAYAEV